MSTGAWTPKVSDTTVNDIGTVTNWQLLLYGDEDSNNDSYVYTSEFGAAFKSADTARRSLSNNSGEGTINVSAIDLEGKADSTIAGCSLLITSGTTIENVIAGDGNDTINGNTAANSLLGGCGNDLLDGGAGDDRLIGGAGDDTLIGGQSNDRLEGGDGNDTVDYSDSDGSIRIDLADATRQTIGTD